MSMSNLISSSESNRSYKESNSYNQNIIDKVREQSKEENYKIFEKYSFDKELLRLKVELIFDLDMHCKLKINRLICNYKLHGE